ncbi:MAG: hypothetical protein IKR19_08155 [Acholeplasmatales bacterium]|nr:hypothetical protein [Acholeplasmatales bacterium]
MMNYIDQIIRENFDLSDKYTRQYIVGLEEADKEALIDVLANQLYDQIVSNVDQIDFGTIPMSRGDITKVENFEKTEQCLSIMRKLVLEYKQNPAIIDCITTAIQNVKDLRGPFIKGFALNVEFPIFIYNLIVLCIERSVSMIIATCVQFISDPKTKTMKQALDKVAYTKTQEDVMFKQLASFNTLCKDGTMIKLIDSTIKNNKTLREAGLEYNIQNTPEDNDIDATMPVEPTDEDNDVEVVADPFGTNEPDSAVPDVAAPTAEPIPSDTEEVPPQEPVAGEFVPNTEPAEIPQTDDLPVTEPDDIPEPVPVVVPVQPEDEVPDVAPNPETDPTLGTEEPVVETDPEEPADAPMPNEEPQEYTPDPNAEEPFVEGKAPSLASTAAKVFTSGINAYSQGGKAVKIAAASTAILAALGLARVSKKVLLDVIIPGARDLVYIVLSTSFKVSDYFRIQAEFFEANADELENSSDMDPDKKEKVVKKQRKWAETFRKWSNLFNLDKKKTEQQVEKKKKEDEKNKKKVATDDDGDDVLF